MKCAQNREAIKKWQKKQKFFGFSSALSLNNASKTEILWATLDIKAFSQGPHNTPPQIFDVATKLYMYFEQKQII